MRKMFKKICFVVSVMLMLSLFTGCGSTKEAEVIQPIHAVLIVQPVSTVPIVNVQAAEEWLKQISAVPNSTLSIIVADGEPWQYAAFEPKPIDSSLASVMQEKILNERVQELTQIIRMATAIHPESNMCGAIELGARNLHSYNDNGRKEMIILGSCINTTAPLTMQNTVLSNLDIEAVIENLKEEAYIEDLEDVNVTIFNLGDVAGLQPEISKKDKMALKELWTSYFEEANAKDICFREDLPSGLTYEGLPEMSMIPVEDMETVVLDEESIAFEKGTAVLINPTEAENVVSVIAEYMIKNDTKALLVGETARWGQLFDSITLSYERGEAIKELFVKNGVLEENLTVIGTGWLSDFYKNDNLSDGSLNEEIAQKNRACIWINADSKLAENIWNDTDFEHFIVEK